MVAEKKSATEMVEDAIRADMARRQPAIDRVEVFAERRDEWRRRWYLALAVGNGAGGAALTSALISTLDKAAPLGFMLFGIWCFAVGLIASGSIPFLRGRWFDRYRDAALVEAYYIEHGGKRVVATGDGGDEMEDAETASERYYNSRDRWGIAINTAQVAGALGFVGGLLFPLVGFTGWLVCP